MLQFSVIIPTYNRAEFLKRCLNSVLACSLENIEVLVSDNASPDNTQEVLKTFKDPRLRFWRNESDIGGCRNMLNLLNVARGEWVFCLGDDDFLLPNSLERLIPVVQSDADLGVVLSPCMMVDPIGNYLWTYQFYNRTARFSEGMEALSRMFGASHVFSRICVRSKWLDLTGTERHLESMYPQMYLVGTILKEHPGFYLNECLVAVTQGGHNFWEYQKDYKVGDRIKMVKDMLPVPRWKSERQTLIQQIVSEVSGLAYPMLLTWSKSPISWVATQVAVLRIQEVAFSGQYWLGLPRFLKTKAILEAKRLLIKLVNLLRGLPSDRKKGG